MTISGKIIVWTLLALLVADLLTFFLLRNFLKEDLLASEESLLKRYAQQEVLTLETIAPQNIKELGNSLAEGIALRTNTWVTIFSSDGEVLGDSLQPTPQENLSTAPEVRSALSGQVSLENRFTLSLKERRLFLAYPFYSGSEHFILRLSIREDMGLDLFLRIPSTIWYALLSGNLLVLFGSWLLALHFSRPVNLMIKKIKEAEQGKIAPLALERSDELGLLASQMDGFLEQFSQISAKLETLEEMIKKLESLLRDGLLLFDSELRVIYVSVLAQDLLMTPEKRLLNRTLLESTLEYSLQDAIKKALESQTEQKVAIGSRVLAIRAIRLEKSSPAALMTLISDLSEVESLRQVRRDFIANISHELKTPIASCKMMIETLLENKKISPQFSRDLLQRSLNEINYLQGLVEALTKLSLVESGKMEYSLKIFDLRELLQDVEASLKDKAKEKGLAFFVDQPGKAIMVQVDYYMLKEAFMAILDNSFKFTPPGKLVSVTVETDHGWVNINFRDQGPGIPQEELPRIFERFYKVEKGRATAGFGIGLSLAKHIVESFGGKISAISDLGKGSLFIVRLRTSSKGEGQKNKAI